MKKCSTCKIQKENKEFGKDIRSKDEYKSACKSCRGLEYKNYYKNNKQKEAKRQKNYYIQNTQKILNRGLKYRTNNKEKEKARLKKI